MKLRPDKRSSFWNKGQEKNSKIPSLASCQPQQGLLTSLTRGRLGETLYKSTQNKGDMHMCLVGPCPWFLLAHVTHISSQDVDFNTFLLSWIVYLVPSISGKVHILSLACYSLPFLIFFLNYLPKPFTSLLVSLWNSFLWRQVRTLKSQSPFDLQAGP